MHDSGVSWDLYRHGIGISMYEVHTIDKNNNVYGTHLIRNQVKVWCTPVFLIVFTYKERAMDQPKSLYKGVKRATPSTESAI